MAAAKKNKTKCTLAGNSLSIGRNKSVRAKGGSTLGSATCKGKSKKK